MLILKHNCGKIDKKMVRGCDSVAPPENLKK
jgi:hypothetical protein